MSQGDFILEYKAILASVSTGKLTMQEAEEKVSKIVEKYNQEKSTSQN